MDRIEAIERATLAAVPPQRLKECCGWLLALDDGTVGRCHSAVPLHHGEPQADSLGIIERQYAEAELVPVLRLPELAALEHLQQELRARAYSRMKPTLVQVGEVDKLAHARSASGPAELVLATSPSADWEHVFLGDGFDPVDGASRLAILRRGRDSLFASVRVDGRTVAVGSCCFSHGWCGVHGMRTLPAHRGRGFAGAILSALGRAARERQVAHCFLQVEQANTGAQSLYAARGFRHAWGYSYWKCA